MGKVKKVDLEKVKQDLKVIRKQYEDGYENPESMANDLLDQADNIIGYLDIMVNILQMRIGRLEDFAKQIEDFEAELIEDNEVWDTEDGLPKITQKFYDKWIDLQNLRNKILNRNMPEARKSDEILAEN